MKIFEARAAKKHLTQSTIHTEMQLDAPVQLTPDQLEIIAAGTIPGRGPVIVCGGPMAGQTASTSKVQ